MKNYYVMNAYSVMQFRGTLDECREWVERRQRDFRNYGMRAPVFRIFYDSATEPCETFA